MAAPSGKFCRPIPIANATAAANVVEAPADVDKAKDRPTAMPSGMLCSVTANTSIVVLFRELFGPSGSSLPGCRCGSALSSASRNRPPNTKPPPAGSHSGIPSSFACSMLGIKRLQTEAAIITPAAKPRKADCIPCFISLRIKKIVAAPRAVIKNVNPVPIAASIYGFVIVIKSPSSLLL